LARSSASASLRKCASLLKDSSLAYVIGAVELSMIGNRIQAESFQPIPVFITVAAIYLTLTSFLTTFSRALERSPAIGGR
jgi:polar amino acid transport system permease protein